MHTINFTTETILYIPTTAFTDELHPERDHTKIQQVWHDALAPIEHHNGPASISLANP